MNLQVLAAIDEAQRLETAGEWLEAARIYHVARGHAPDDHRLAVHQGNALWLADLPAAAWCCFRQALAISPSCSRTLRGAAQVLRDLNRFEEADRLHARSVLEEDPDPALAKWAHSQVLLGLECYEAAFAVAEGRLEQDGAPSALTAALAEHGLELQSEQGIGDTLQFLRWLPLLIRRRHDAGRQEPITLYVPPALVQLIREGLAWLDTPPQVLPKSEEWRKSGSATRLGSLMSLPFLLGGAPLAETVPYLRSPLWAGTANTLLEGVSAGECPLVGLVWEAGRKTDHPFTAREYHKRSLPAAVLDRLSRGLVEAGAMLVPLQWGGEAHLLETLEIPHRQCQLSLGDFTVTARVLAMLDLVISVDTAMAHLIGAMGRPGWVLLPASADPRWLRDRADTPWYPSLRLFRQHHAGDWHSAVNDLLKAFRSSFATRESLGNEPSSLEGPGPELGRATG